MTISGLCVDIQIASGNHNCWSTHTSITQSFASCNIPDLLCFLDNVLHCLPSFTKVIILSLHSFLTSFLTWFIMTCISCAITLITALWRNLYLPLCNAFWQPANIWATLASSFLQRAHSMSSSNPQQAYFCGDANALYVAPRQNKTNGGVDFRRLCQLISLNITLLLRPLSLDWLLHCFCVKAFTFCFPDYYRTFSAILLLLIIKHLPPFYTPKSSPTSLCVAQTLWYFYSAIYITCFDCNFPLSNCIKFWDLVSGWLVSGLLEL